MKAMRNAMKMMRPCKNFTKRNENGVSTCEHTSTAAVSAGLLAGAGLGWLAGWLAGLLHLASQLRQIAATGFTVNAVGAAGTQSVLEAYRTPNTPTLWAFRIEPVQNQTKHNFNKMCSLRNSICAQLNFDVAPNVTENTLTSKRDVAFLCCLSITQVNPRSSTWRYILTWM